MSKRNGERRRRPEAVRLMVLDEARKVPFSSYVSPQALATLQEISQEEGTPQVALVREALNLLFVKRGKPRA